MAKLELDCPACGKQLELDAGFAGGVCRCFECGTLMTVPAERRGRAEQLVRPDHPPGTTSRPESPLAELTLTTVSGQTVEIDERAIPTALRRRTGVRVTTALIFFGLLLAVVGACVAAMLVLLHGPQIIENDAPTEHEFRYDANANPYLLEHENVLGLPVNDQAVVIIDASYASRQWLNLVNDALSAGLIHPGGIADVLLIYATEDAPVPYTKNYTRFSAVDRADLSAFQSQIAALGVAPLDAPFDAALAANPAQIILVTGQALDAKQVESIKQRVAIESKLVFDAITIGQFNSKLQDLNLDHKGRYVDLPPSQLERWYRAVEHYPNALGPAPPP